jgi:DNA adenine methylase
MCQHEIGTGAKISRMVIGPSTSKAPLDFGLEVDRKPFRSPLRYPGGKQKAIDQIAKMLPKSATEFREPMVGGGSVFFHARSTNLAKKYWINDKFKELISFWRIAQDPKSCKRLVAELEQLHASFSSADEIKEYFLQAREESPRSAFRQALLFFFFNRVTFSGTTRAGGFSTAASLQRFTLSSIERLKPLPEALDDVRITNDDFESVIMEPGRDVFIFLDPPYWSATRLYGKNGALHAFDHERLANVLRDTGHRFLITYDDCAEIRGLYSWASVRTWRLQYGMNNCNSANSSKIGSELFISNY